MKSSFPVTKLNYEVVGIVTLKRCSNVPEHERDTIIVKDIMFPKNKIRLLKVNDTAEKALSIMIKENQDKILVCDDRDILEGVVSKTDIIEAMDEQKSFFNSRNKLIWIPEHFLVACFDGSWLNLFLFEIAVSYHYMSIIRAILLAVKCKIVI